MTFTNSKWVSFGKFFELFYKFWDYADFDRGDYIPQKHIKKVTNYICGQLTSWSPNRSYFQAEYNYATNLIYVCLWKRKRGLPALAKKGEAICGDELVNFFEDKNHKNCTCSTVWTFWILILFYKHLRGMIRQFLYNKLYIVLIVSLGFSPNKKI